MAKKTAIHLKPVSESTRFVEQAKLLRVLQLVQFLHCPRTLRQIAERFDISTRTAQRYILMISEAGFTINKTPFGWNGIYFSIKKDHCPLCGKEVHHG